MDKGMSMTVLKAFLLAKMGFLQEIIFHRWNEKSQRNMENFSQKKWQLRLSDHLTTLTKTNYTNSWSNRKTKQETKTRKAHYDVNNCKFQTPKPPAAAFFRAPSLVKTNCRQQKLFLPQQWIRNCNLSTIYLWNQQQIEKTVLEELSRICKTQMKDNNLNNLLPRKLWNNFETFSGFKVNQTNSWWAISTWAT